MEKFTTLTAVAILGDTATEADIKSLRLELGLISDSLHSTRTGWRCSSGTACSCRR